MGTENAVGRDPRVVLQWGRAGDLWALSEPCGPPSGSEQRELVAIQRG